MQGKINLTIFFAVTTILIALIAGFFANQNQKLVRQARNASLLTPSPTPTPSPSPTPIGLANPAAVFCVEQGGESTVKTDTDGSQTGLCTVNGKVYDEWEYYRDNYGTTSPAPTSSAKPSSSPKPIGTGRSTSPPLTTSY